MNEFAPSNKLLLTGVAILLVGLALTFLGFSADLDALGVLGAGLAGFSVVLIFRLLIAKKNRAFAKEIVVNQKDERQLQIFLHAGNMAFWIGMFAILGLGIITRSEDPVVLFSPVVMLATYLISALYYRRKF